MAGEVEFTEEFEVWWNHSRSGRTGESFDPRRVAIFPIGGEKTGDDRCYKTVVPRADSIYDRHLKGLDKEGAN